MMRVDRLVVPEPKSFCSTRSVLLPWRAHSRAMATPLIPPPITRTSNPRPCNGRELLTPLSLDAFCAYGNITSEQVFSPRQTAGPKLLMCAVYVSVLTLGPP